MVYNNFDCVIDQLAINLKRTYMRKNPPLIVAGIIFVIITIVHLLRIIFHTEIIVSGHSLSFCISIGALIISTLLAIWMFLAASSKQ